MASLEQIITPDIQQNLSTFEDLGGVLDFKFLKVLGTGTDLEAHLLTANKTLQLLDQDNDSYFEKVALSLGTNREDYFKIAGSQNLANTGTQIEPEEFFGPYFNFKEQRPILLGKSGKPYGDVIVYSDYYYYDDIETAANIISINNNQSDFAVQGYADAFLNPPHSFGQTAMTNFEIGDFFLAFNDFLFDDINKIIIYKWPTDCSNYFDAGKEWWGSFFWTVYNPTKEWYIGIAASTTD